MNERIKQLAIQAGWDNHHSKFDTRIEKFAQLIVQEYASEYNKLITGKAVVLPKDCEHARALICVGMLYLENNR